MNSVAAPPSSASPRLRFSLIWVAYRVRVLPPAETCKCSVLIIRSCPPPPPVTVCRPRRRVMTWSDPWRAFTVVVCRSQASVGLVALTLLISLWVRVGTEADCVAMTALDAGTGAQSSACQTHIVTEAAASLANAVCPATTRADSPFVPVTTEGDSGWMDFVGAILWWMVALLIVECISLFIINRTHRGLRHLVKRGLHAADRITKGMNHVEPIVAKSSAVTVRCRTVTCAAACRGFQC